MDSFAKYAEESMKKIPSLDLKGGNETLQNAFLDTLFKPSESLVAPIEDVLPPQVPSTLLGGVDFSGPLPTLEGSDFAIAQMYWDDGDYWGLISGIVRFFMAMGLYLVLYWLFSPGQMLQLWNSRKFCNTQIYGKLNTSDINAQYYNCKAKLQMPPPSNRSIPTTGQDYVGSWVEYQNCDALVRCSKRGLWGSYYTSWTAIIIHGVLLGVVLSLLPMLKDNLGFLHIDYYLKSVSDMCTYLMGWMIYLAVGLPMSIFYGIDYGNTFMPEYEKITNY